MGEHDDPGPSGPAVDQPQQDATLDQMRHDARGTWFDYSSDTPGDVVTVDDLNITPQQDTEG